MARLINVNANLILDLPKGLSPIWGQLIAITGAEDKYPSGALDERSVLKFLISDATSSVSILSCLAYARENARTIRDRISREMWEDINGLYHAVTRFDPAEQISSGPHRFCDAVKFGSHRFFGVTDATLPHDGWDFLKIGWSRVCGMTAAGGYEFSRC
jgi:uncharacterized alpha-E superfamily protein